MLCGYDFDCGLWTELQPFEMMGPFMFFVWY